MGVIQRGTNSVMVDLPRDMTEQLITGGADVNAASVSLQRTPLHVASEHGQLAVARFLIAAGAEVDRADAARWTVLHVAADRKMAELLLRNGAEPQVKTDEGWTPLHTAASRGCIEVVELLIEHGLDAEAEDLFGRTPLDLLPPEDAGLIVNLLHEGTNSNDQRPAAPPGAGPDDDPVGEEAVVQLASTSGEKQRDNPLTDPGQPTASLGGDPAVPTGAPNLEFPIGGGSALIGAAAVTLGITPLLLALLILVSFWKLYSKAGEPGWAVLIPIYHTVVLLRVAGRPWWWLLLLCIPMINVVVCFVIFFDLARNFDKGAGFALGLIFLGFIFLPVLAFGRAEYNPPSGAAPV